MRRPDAIAAALGLSRLADALASEPHRVLAEAESAADLALVDLRVDDIELFIVAFSGGKDSIALVLHLLELGVPRERIELWHHLIDGEGARFFDWPCTSAYCAAFAEAFGIPLRWSYREGGFLREMLRDGTPTAPVAFDTPTGPRVVGGKGPPGRRLRFPQVTADLSVRWCSAYLKIDVAARALANDPRFERGTFALLTGERAEESSARARYPHAEWHRAANRARRVVQWRAVHGWPEARVWSAMERWRINPHPAYRLGFSRVSCMSCIFGNEDQWATVQALAPETFDRIAAFERAFGSTIHRTQSVGARAARGRSLVPAEAAELARASQSERFDEPIIVKDWKLPTGAFRHTGGPT